MAYNKHNVGNNEKSYETIMSDINEESYPGMLILKMK